jgi:hypothetical protein
LARARPQTAAFAGGAGDLAHGAEVALGGDGEARLDDVHAHLVEEAGDLELLLVGHGGAGRLLAVAQGGVEDDHAVGHVLAPGPLAPTIPPSGGADEARSEAAKEERARHDAPTISAMAVGGKGGGRGGAAA